MRIQSLLLSQGPPAVFSIAHRSSSSWCSLSSCFMWCKQRAPELFRLGQSFLGRPRSFGISPPQRLWIWCRRTTFPHESCKDINTRVLCTMRLSSWQARLFKATATETHGTKMSATLLAGNAFSATLWDLFLSCLAGSAAVECRLANLQTDSLWDEPNSGELVGCGRVTLASVCTCRNAASALLGARSLRSERCSYFVTAWAER